MLWTLELHYLVFPCDLGLTFFYLWHLNDLKFHTQYLMTIRCIRLWRGVHRLAKDGMLAGRLAIVCQRAACGMS